LAYLTAFFNSKIFRFAFKEYFPELLGDTRELSKVFFETVTAREVGEETNNEFERLLNDVINLREQGLSSIMIEKKIQDKLAKLYSLSESAIALIESSESVAVSALPIINALSAPVSS
jgi:adenine-specific DNA-methyltransferase